MSILRTTSIGRSVSVRPIIQRMEVGESLSYVRPMEPGDAQAATKMVRAVSAAVTQSGLGYTFTYESFTALTSRQLPVVGVVATRMS